MSNQYKLIAQFWERDSNGELVQTWKKNIALHEDGDTDILKLKQSVEARYLAATNSHLHVLELLDGDDCSIEWNAGSVVRNHFVYWQSAAGARKEQYTLKIVRAVDPEEQERRRREGTVSYGGSIDFRSITATASRSSASTNNPSHTFHGARNPDQPLPSSERDTADAVVVPDTPLSRKRRHSREHGFRPAPGSRDSSLLLTHIQQQANPQPQPAHDRSSTTPKSESPSERNLQPVPELPVLTTIESIQNDTGGDIAMTNGVEHRPSQTPSNSSRRQANGFSTLDHSRSASKEALRRTSMTGPSPREKVWEPESQTSRTLFKKPTPLKRPTKAGPNASARQEEVLVNGTAGSSAPNKACQSVSQAGSSVVSETSQEASGRQANGDLDIATPSNATSSNGNTEENLDSLIKGDVTPEEMENAMNVDVPEITVGDATKAVPAAAVEAKRKTFGTKTPTQNRPDFVGFDRNSPKSILRRPSFASDTGTSSNSTARTTSPNLSRRSVEFHAGPPSILGPDEEPATKQPARKTKGRKKTSQADSTSEDSDDSDEADSDFQAQAETEGEEDEEGETPKAAACKTAPQSAKKAAAASIPAKQGASKQALAIEAPRPSTAKRDVAPKSGSAAATPGGDAWAAWRDQMFNSPAPNVPPRSAAPSAGKSASAKTKVESKASAAKATLAKATPARKDTKTPVTKSTGKTATKTKSGVKPQEAEKPEAKRTTAGNKNSEKASAPSKDSQKPAAENTPAKSGVKDVNPDSPKITTTTPASLPAKLDKKQPSTMQILNAMKERSKSASVNPPGPDQSASKVPEAKSTPVPAKKPRVPPGSRAKGAAISSRPSSKGNTIATDSSSPAPDKPDARSSKATTAKLGSKNKLTDTEKIVAIKQEPKESTVPARKSSDAQKIAALQENGASSDQPHEISSAEESSSESDSDAASEIPGRRTGSRELNPPKLPTGASKESSADSDSDSESDDDSDEDADAKLKAALNNGPKSSQSISLTPPAQRRKEAESEATTEADVEMPDASPDKSASVPRSQKSVPRALQNNEDEEAAPSSARTVKPVQPTIDYSDSESEEYDVPAPHPINNQKPITKRAISESSQASSDASVFTRLPMPKKTPLVNGKKSESQATTESPSSTQGRVTSQLNSEAAAFTSTQEPLKSSQFGTLDTPTPAVGKGSRAASGKSSATPKAQLTSAQKPAASLSRMMHKRAQSKSSQSATPTSAQKNANARENDYLVSMAAAMTEEEDEASNSDDDDDDEDSNDSDNSDAEKRPGSKAKSTAKAHQGWMSIVNAKTKV